MTFRFYSNTDPSAPVLNGTLGSLKNVLRGCLVTGYGSRNPAGWTEHFDATNVFAIRQSTVGHSGFYLRVDDAFSTTETLLRGFQTMTDFNTGTGPFPTVAQRTNGIFVRKRVSASATAVNWRMLADSGTFYLFVDSYNTGDFTGFEVYYFGSFDSAVTGDVANVILGGRSVTGTGTQYASTTTTNNGTMSVAMYVAERHDNIDSSAAFIPGYGMLGSDNARLGLVTGTNFFRAYNDANSALLTAPVYIGTETATTDRTIRGTFRGLRMLMGNTANIPIDSTFAEGADEYITMGIGGGARVGVLYPNIL